MGDLANELDSIKSYTPETSGETPFPQPSQPQATVGLNDNDVDVSDEALTVNCLYIFVYF